MRLVTLGFVVLALHSIAFESKAQEKPLAEQKGLRCAYIGRNGSFHLIGKGGSAAYILGGKKYVADLRSADEDDDFWYYTPRNGDNFTEMWAFSRRRDACGLYGVFRYQGNAWHHFEQTSGWGEGLDRPVRVVYTSDLEVRIEALERRVRKLEDKP
ncbi:MAG: hypothetical protein AB7F94_15250 [Nitrospira sp.]